MYCEIIGTLPEPSHNGRLFRLKPRIFLVFIVIQIPDASHFSQRANDANVANGVN